MRTDENDAVHITEGAALFMDGCQFLQRRQICASPASDMPTLHHQCVRPPPPEHERVVSKPKELQLWQVYCVMR